MLSDQPAHDVCIIDGPLVVADGAPQVAVLDLNTTCKLRSQIGSGGVRETNRYIVMWILSGDCLFIVECMQ